MKHSVGPWTPLVDGESGSHRRMAMVATNRGCSVCIDCTGSGKNFEQDAYNARLTALGPEMYDLLRHAAEVLAACDAHVDIGDGEGRYGTVALAEKIDELLARIE
jgi:hypothetical protein